MKRIVRLTVVAVLVLAFGIGYAVMMIRASLPIPNTIPHAKVSG